MSPCSWAYGWTLLTGFQGIGKRHRKDTNREKAGKIGGNMYDFVSLILHIVLNNKIIKIKRYDILRNYILKGYKYSKKLFHKSGKKLKHNHKT